MQFSGKTQIQMADGTTKAIEDVKIGDEVRAADSESGEEGIHTVTAVWVHDDQILDLVVEGKTVETTEDHPFWNDTDQQWQCADTLDRGDRLFGIGGARPSVGGIQLGTVRTAPANNLTVADIHTFNVLAGNTPVLVHNTCPHLDLSGTPEELHPYIENSVWHYDNYVNGGRAPGVG